MGEERDQTQQSSESSDTNKGKKSKHDATSMAADVKKRQKRSPMPSNLDGEQDEGGVSPFLVEGGGGGDAASCDQVIKHLETQEWILQRPDAMIGSVDKQPLHFLAFREEEREGKSSLCVRMAQVDAPPALVKMAGELISNAVDNVARSKSGNVKQKVIDIHISKQTGEICVSNDGVTIPIQLYEDTDVYQPTMAFGTFQTSSNYADNEQLRYHSGRNGVGAKGPNAWGKKFRVKIVSPRDGKIFQQTWEDNMQVVSKAQIGSTKIKTPKTTVEWVPDYTRLGMGHVLTDGLSDDEMLLLTSLAYQSSVCVPKECVFSINDRKVVARTADDIMKGIGISSGCLAKDKVLVDGVPRLQIFVASCCGKRNIPSDGVDVELKTWRPECGFHPWVNGAICQRGTHTSWIQKKVCDIVLGKARDKMKKAETMCAKPAEIIREMVILCMMEIPNPRYASQLKSELVTPVKEFGLVWTPSDSFVATLAKSDLVERAIELSRLSSDRDLSRVAKSVKGRMHIPMYQAAQRLKSGKACLFITEGNSALNFAVVGLGVIGRVDNGVFPIRGKLLNTRNAPTSQIVGNREIGSLMQILGLENGRTYDSSSKHLNYRHVVILSDQDPDGSHIRGLIVNFLHSMFPTLLACFPDFIKCFATPLVRVELGKEDVRNFFTERDFRVWRQEREAASKTAGRAKYYKGLGAISNTVAKVLFEDIDRHMVTLQFTGEECARNLNMYFGDDPEDRKQILTKFSEDDVFDFSGVKPISDLCKQDLGAYFMYKNKCVLPHVIDGFTTTRRKVLYTCFNTRFQASIKVYQLGGIVAQKTAYHHGDQSLLATISKMAKEYPGTNNIALLVPDGQFGSAMSHEAASARYISTGPDPIARHIFPEIDDSVLTYLEDDGVRIEPVYFVPLLPMILINGATGIGSGYMTEIPMHRPIDVLDLTLAYIEKEFDGNLGLMLPSICPWYRGHTGDIMPCDGGFMSHGKCHLNTTGDEVHISELPIGSKESNEVVEDLRKKLVVKDGLATSVEQCSTDIWKTHILIKVAKDKTGVDVMAALKLEKKIYATRMHLWSPEGELKLYTTHEITAEHAKARIACTSERLKKQIETALRELKTASEKRRYIRMARDGDIDLRVASKAALSDQLVAKNFDENQMGGFDYLLGMAIYRLTESEYTKLVHEEERLTSVIEELRQTCPVKQWKRELNVLKAHLSEYDKRCQGNRR